MSNKQHKPHARSSSQGAIRETKTHAKLFNVISTIAVILAALLIIGWLITLL
jgi:hypothetical protein